MDHSATLKKNHLLDIISYLKVASGKQLIISEKNTPEQYLEMCLFHGYMKEENKDEHSLVYDPDVYDSPELNEHKKIWSTKLSMDVSRSLKRYYYYIDKGEIRIDELAPYEKRWMGSILEKLGDDSLAKVSEEHVRELYREVIISY